MSRKTIKASQNIFSDSQGVYKENLALEQSYNNTVTSGIISNHIGDGIVRDSLSQNILFDSSTYTSHTSPVDGVPISLSTAWTAQPSDTVNGNQLEIAVDKTLVSGRRAIKIAVFGYDLNQKLISETFRFTKNEIQITKYHYTTIKSILVNDFDTGLTLAGAGKITIAEAKPIFVSRDVISVAQNQEPSVFFRDFTPSLSYANITALLNAALPNENWAALLSLNSSTITLPGSDITTQVGQKFFVTTSNIQKIRILLSSTQASDTAFGALTLSVYSLQTELTDPTQFVPGLAIAYDPDLIPLASVDVNPVLNTTPRPVDFFFNNTALATNKLKAGQFYIFTIKNRNANSDTLTISTSVTKWIEDSRISVFSIIGSTSTGIWTDDPNRDLWFEVYSDAVKVTDGQYYVGGTGTSIDKSTKGADAPVLQINSPDFGSHLNLNVVASIYSKTTKTIQDGRTGNKVVGAAEDAPQIQLLNSLNDLSNPLVIGNVKDTNDNTGNPITSYSGHNNILVSGNEIYFIEDPTAVAPANTSFNKLHSDVISKDFSGADLAIGFNTNISHYIIDKAEIISGTLGDCSGNGIVGPNDQADITKLVSSPHWTTVPTSTFDSFINSVRSDSTYVADSEFDIIKLINADINKDGIIDASDSAAVSAFVSRITSYNQQVSKTYTIIKLTLSAATDTRNDDHLKTTSHQIPNLNSDTNINTHVTSDLVVNVTLDSSWKETNISVINHDKYVSATFASPVQAPGSSCTVFGQPVQRVDLQTSSGSKVDIYFPNDLIVGGQIRSEEGGFHKSDLEIHNIIFYLPQQSWGPDPTMEVSINIFNNLIAEADACSGLTDQNFPAMKFADGTFVQNDALIKDQLRFGVAVESYVPTANATIARVGVSFDDRLGVLKMNFDEMSPYVEATDSIVTKVRVTVYGKKAGFNNQALKLSADQVTNLLATTGVSIATLPFCSACLTKTVVKVFPNNTGTTYTATTTDGVIEVSSARTVVGNIDISALAIMGREITIQNSSSVAMTVLDTIHTISSGAVAAGEGVTFVFDGSGWIKTSNYNIGGSAPPPPLAITAVTPTDASQTYTVLSTDDFVEVMDASPVRTVDAVINISGIGAAGRRIIVKNSATGSPNTTVSDSTHLIEGGATLTVKSGECVTLIWDIRTSGPTWIAESNFNVGGGATFKSVRTITPADVAGYTVPGTGTPHVISISDGPSDYSHPFTISTMLIATSGRELYIQNNATSDLVVYDTNHGFLVAGAFTTLTVGAGRTSIIYFNGTYWVETSNFPASADISSAGTPVVVTMTLQTDYVSYTAVVTDDIIEIDGTQVTFHHAIDFAGVTTTGKEISIVNNNALSMFMVSGYASTEVLPSLTTTFVYDGGQWIPVSNYNIVPIPEPWTVFSVTKISNTNQFDPYVAIFSDHLIEPTDASYDNHYVDISGIAGYGRIIKFSNTSAGPMMVMDLSHQFYDNITGLLRSNFIILRPDTAVLQFDGNNWNFLGQTFINDLCGSTISSITGIYDTNNGKYATNVYSDDIRLKAFGANNANLHPDQSHDTLFGYTSYDYNSSSHVDHVLGGNLTINGEAYNLISDPIFTSGNAGKIYGGNVVLHGGNITTTISSQIGFGGAVNLIGGDAPLHGGSISIGSGNGINSVSGSTSGNVTISTGSGQTAGNINITSGSTNIPYGSGGSYGKSGDVNITAIGGYSAGTPPVPGNVTIRASHATNNVGHPLSTSGNVVLTTGMDMSFGTFFSSGYVFLEGGDGINTGGPTNPLNPFAERFLYNPGGGNNVVRPGQVFIKGAIDPSFYTTMSMTTDPFMISFANNQTFDGVSATSTECVTIAPKKFITKVGRRKHVTNVNNTSSYDLIATDEVVNVTTTTACTVTLPITETVFGSVSGQAFRNVQPLEGDTYTIHCSTASTAAVTVNSGHYPFEDGTTTRNLGSVAGKYSLQATFINNGSVNRWAIVIYQ